MGTKVVFLVPTMFSQKKYRDKKGRDSLIIPAWKSSSQAPVRVIFLSSEMYRRLDNSSTGCMASGIRKAGDRNVLRFLWNEREEVGKEYVGCGGWKADALSQKSQKTCTHSAQLLPPVKKQPGGAAETPRVEDRQFCTTHKKCDLIVPGCTRSEGLHKRSPEQSSEHPLESPQDGSFLSLEFNFLAH